MLWSRMIGSLSRTTKFSLRKWTSLFSEPLTRRTQDSRRLLQSSTIERSKLIKMQSALQKAINKSKKDDVQWAVWPNRTISKGHCLHQTSRLQAKFYFFVRSLWLACHSAVLILYKQNLWGLPSIRVIAAIIITFLTLLSIFIENLERYRNFLLFSVGLYL